MTSPEQLRGGREVQAWVLAAQASLDEALAARVAYVREAALAGHSDQEIGDSLGLSRHTVRGEAASARREGRMARRAEPGGGG